MKKNRTIGFVAPAGSIEKEELSDAIMFFQQSGFTIRSGKHLFGRHRHYSGSITERAADINNFLKDDDIDIIYAVRGGSGSAMILDYIDWELWNKQKKPLIGFSDITALQLALFKKTGNFSLSGMSGNIHMKESNSYIDLSFAVLNGKSQIEAKDLNTEISIRKEGIISGLLLGGCLTMITTLTGTDYFPQTEENIILIIEDVNEPLYVVERNLVHLQQIGFLDNVKGLILGKFTDNGHELDVWQECGYLFENVEVVVSEFPYGHVTDSLTVPLGLRATLSSSVFKLDFPYKY